MNINLQDLRPTGGEFSSPGAQEQPGLDLHRQLALLRRRLKFCLAIALIVFLGMVIFTFHATPKYTAMAQVMLDQRQQQVTDVKEVLSGLPPESGVVETEVEVLKSRTLADKVVTALNLDQDREFNPALAPPGLRQVVFGAVSGLFGVSDRPRGARTELQEEIARARVVDSVLSRLKVARSGLTFVINISFQSTSAQKAALIANTFADKYLTAQLDAKFDATKRANDWLNSRLSGLREQAEASEAAARQFEAANGLVGVQSAPGPGGGASINGATIAQQEISNLSTQVAAARAQLAEAQANLGTARAQLANGSTGGDVGGALTSPVIQSLRKQHADISSQVADLSGKYGPRHPEMLKAQRELADVDAQIQAEIGRITSNLEAQVEVARQRTLSLESSLSRSKGSLNMSNTAAGHLAQLQSRAQADASVYQNFLDRFKQTSAQQGIEQSDARVVSYAKVPTSPSAPNVPLNLALGLVLGIGAAGAAIFVMEALEDGLYTSEDVEQTLGIPHLGSIPRLDTTLDFKRDVRSHGAPLDYAFANPLSSYAEAFRNLRTSILFSRTGEPVKVVTITSSLPGEGKTVTSICLARTLAMGGTKTVLVDCDLRKRSVLQKLGHTAKVGLLEVLNGVVSLDDALLYDELSGAYILPLTTSDYTPKDVFASVAMDRLLDDLRTRFEIVLLDTAPILPIADTRVLAPKSDVVVFLAHWRKTPRKAVENGLLQLDAVGAHVAGIALTLIDAKEQARSGYGDAGYYYKAYKSYYGYGASSAN
jgi:exopolysaccharide transport family protein